MDNICTDVGDLTYRKLHPIP